MIFLLQQWKQRTGDFFERTQFCPLVNALV